MRAIVNMILLLLAITATGCIELRNSPYDDNIKTKVRNANAINGQIIAQKMQTNDFKFAFITDSHNDYRDFESVIHLLNRRDDIDFIVHAGDITDFSFADEYDLAMKVLEQSRHPYLIAIGNHDSIGIGPQIFKKIFGPKDFTVDFASTRIIVWNNNSLEYKDKLRYDWFEETLAESDQFDQVIILQHVNIGNTLYFSNERNQWFQDLLANSNVDLILNGHRHVFITEMIGDVLVHQAASTDELRYSIVEFNNGTISIEQCEADKCVDL